MRGIDFLKLNEHPITVCSELSTRFHFVDPGFVGFTTACEAVNMMYKLLPSFNSPLTAHLADLPYICGDPFGVGHCATAALRQLRITCKVDRYRIKNKCKSHRRKECTHTASERAYTHRAIIRQEAKVPA